MVTTFDFFRNDARVLGTSLSGNDLVDLVNAYFAEEDSRVRRAQKWLVTAFDKEKRESSSISIDDGEKPNGANFTFNDYRQVAVLNTVLQELDTLAEGLRVASPAEIVAYCNSQNGKIPIEKHRSFGICVPLGVIVKDRYAFEKYELSAMTNLLCWNQRLEGRTLSHNTAGSQPIQYTVNYNLSGSITFPFSDRFSFTILGHNEQVLYFDFPGSLNRDQVIRLGHTGKTRMIQTKQGNGPNSWTDEPISVDGLKMLQSYVLLARDQ
ncbi:hypothetical protein HYV86_02535 [Candidatus Woesearchaeota archaeon]|nr:hypothetical protein [Candidatus Woesearchaeota archaeon]